MVPPTDSPISLNGGNTVFLDAQGQKLRGKKTVIFDFSLSFIPLLSLSSNVPNLFKNNPVGRREREKVAGGIDRTRLNMD